MAERPFLQVIPARHGSQQNTVGIKHMKAILADLLDLPRRGKTAVLVA
jgi:hypothetical protein